MKTYLIGVVKQGTRYRGFRLLDIDSKQVVDVTHDALYDALINNKIIIENVEIENGLLRGKNGSFNRYPVLNSSINRKKPITIVGKNNDIFLCADCNGNITNIKKEDLIQYAKQFGISNAKVVDDHISAIEGTLQSKEVVINTNQYITDFIDTRTDRINSNIVVSYNRHSIEIMIDRYYDTEVTINCTESNDGNTLKLPSVAVHGSTNTLKIKQGSNPQRLDINICEINNLVLLGNCKNSSVHIYKSIINSAKINIESSIKIDGTRIQNLELICGSLSHCCMSSSEQYTEVNNARIRLTAEKYRSEIYHIKFNRLQLQVDCKLCGDEYSGKTVLRLMVCDSAEIIFSGKKQTVMIDSAKDCINCDFVVKSQYKLKLMVAPYTYLKSLKCGEKVYLVNIPQVSNGIVADNIILDDVSMFSSGSIIHCKTLKVVKSACTNRLNEKKADLYIEKEVILDENNGSADLKRFRDTVIIHTYYNSNIYNIAKSAGIEIDIIDKENIPQSMIKTSMKETLLSVSILEKYKNTLANIFIDNPIKVSSEIIDTGHKIALTEDIKTALLLGKSYNCSSKPRYQSTYEHEFAQVSCLMYLIEQMYIYDDSLLSDESIDKLNKSPDLMKESIEVFSAGETFKVYNTIIKNKNYNDIDSYVVVIDKENIVYCANIGNTIIHCIGHRCERDKEIVDIINKLDSIDVKNHIVEQSISTNVPPDTYRTFERALSHIIRNTPLIIDKDNNKVYMCIDKNIYKYSLLGYSNEDNRKVFNNVELSIPLIYALGIDNTPVEPIIAHGSVIRNTVYNKSNTLVELPKCEISQIYKIARKFKYEILGISSSVLAFYSKELELEDELFYNIIQLPFFASVDKSEIPSTRLQNSNEESYIKLKDCTDLVIKTYRSSRKTHSKILNEYQDTLDEIVEIDDNGIKSYYTTSIGIKKLLKNIQQAYAYNIYLEDYLSYSYYGAPESLGIVLHTSPTFRYSGIDYHRYAVVVDINSGYIYFVVYDQQNRRGKSRRIVNVDSGSTPIFRIQNTKAALMLIKQLSEEYSRLQNITDSDIIYDLIYNSSYMSVMAEMQRYGASSIMSYYNKLDANFISKYIHYMAQYNGAHDITEETVGKQINGYSDAKINTLIAQGFISRVMGVPKGYTLAETFDIGNGRKMDKFTNGNNYIYNINMLGLILSDVEIEEAF